jgi:hypothetical protein
MTDAIELLRCDHDGVRRLLAALEDGPAAAAGPDRSSADNSRRVSSWSHRSSSIASVIAVMPLSVSSRMSASFPPVASRNGPDNREPGKLALPGPQLGDLRGGYRSLLLVLRRLGGDAVVNR